MNNLLTYWGEATMPYYVSCHIPIEPDEPIVFNDIKDAYEEKEHLQDMQPENLYTVVKIKYYCDACKYKDECDQKYEDCRFNQANIDK